MNGYKIAQIHNIPFALTSKSEEFKGMKPTDCLPSVWSMFLHNAHGTMIFGSSFMMIDDRFATYPSLAHYKTDKIMDGLQFRSQVCIQCGEESADAAPANDLEEKSAGSLSLLNVKIIGLLFTTGNFYCLLTRLQKSIKVLVVSTCASPIGLSGEGQGNFYKNTKVGVDYIDQILEMFITKFSTRR